MSKETPTLSEKFTDEELEDKQFSVVFMEGDKVLGIEESVLVENPFEFDVSRLVPSAKFMNLERFFQIAEQLIADAQARAGIIESHRVKFVQDFPPENFDEFGGEVITWTVKNRYPAKMNSSADGRSQFGATHHFKRRTPQTPNKQIIVENVPIDHSISITAWGATADLAERRSNWIEKLLKSHKWAFTSQGVDRFVWKGRTANTTWTPRQQRIHQRSHDFFLRLQEFEVREFPIIQEMSMNFKPARG